MPFSRSSSTSRRARSSAVTITGNEITGTLTTGSTGNGNDKFRTYAPPQYEGLGNKLDEKKRPDQRQARDDESRGRRCSTRGRPSC